MPRWSFSPVVRKSLLVPPLLLALYLLSDDESTTPSSGTASSTIPPASEPYGRRHHLAVLTALRRHPPSLRVFRALSELSLLLFCAAASLCVWERSRVGRDDAVGTLLFRPAGVGADGIDHAAEGAEEEEEEYEMALRSDREGADDGGDEREAGMGGSDDDGGDGGGFADVHGDMWRDDGDGDGDGGAGPIEYRDHRAAAPSSSAARAGPTAGSRSAPPRGGSCSPPSSEAVAGAALDLLLVVLVCLFLFTLSSAEGGRYIDGIGDGAGAPPSRSSWTGLFKYTANVAAPVFPLVLFLLSAARAVLPWSRRREFWAVVSRTLVAPYSDVTFRDGFVGDVLTSTVRPLQDVAFTTFYVLSGLQGWWREEYGIDEAAGPVEWSWLVHTVILPGCMVSPLWWRFLQNLRQTHDNRRRWPYLGNAFKYFVAAEVALFGVFEPDARHNVAWVSCFVLATLYQVLWDVFMDWELLAWDDGDGAPTGGRGRRRSSWWPFRLRSERLYDCNFAYYFIFVANFLLRFCWTMTFIPRRYLSRSGMLTNAYSDDFQAFVGPALASAEIVRRSLWGLLRVELEAIKLSREDRGGVVVDKSRGGDNAGAMTSEEDNGIMWDEELKPMTIGSSAGRGGRLRDLAFSSVGPLLEPHAIVVGSDMSALSDMQILGELCLWATAFTSLGILAAAHRHVM